MKVLFCAKGQETLAIEYISAALKEAGHRVELLFEPEFDGGMGFLPPYGMKLLQRKNRFLDAIKTFDPDLIAFSCPLNIYPFVKKTARLIKLHFSIPIVVGGGHPTLAPDYLMQNPDIDIVCIGEGEEPMVELADKMERGIDYSDTRNFWFRKNGSLIKNEVRPLLEDLDRLPFPDRDLFYHHGCFAGNLYFVAGRGCPFQCTYCCQHAFQQTYRGKGKYVRLRSVENVIQELEVCIKTYDVQHIHSEDDTFTIHHQWLHDFCDEYKKQINVPLYCHVRPGTLSADLLQRMKKAGCEAVFFGIDSGCEELRKSLLKRDISNDTIYSQAKLIKEAGIRLASASMFGLPGETPQQMHETFRMAIDIQSDFAYDSIFYPFYGTELYDYAVQNGYLNEKNQHDIKEGLGSPYQYPLLTGEHNDLAMTMKNCLPAYARFASLRPFLDLVIKKRWLKLSGLVNLLLTPFSYAFMGRLKRKEILQTILGYFKP